MIVPNSRCLWLDGLRAFLALGVAFHHCNPGREDILSEMNDLLLVARVPCFYFIAGFFLGKALKALDYNVAATQITLRFRRLIVPAAVFLLLADSSKIYALMNLSFHENFFLHSLFWSSTIVTVTVLICKYVGIYNYRSYMLLGISVIASLLLKMYSHLNVSAFDLNCTLHSIIFVSAGYCIGNNSLHVPKHFKSPITVLCALTIYVVATIFDIASMCPENIGKLIYRIILPFIGIYALFGMFYLLRQHFRHDNKMGHIAYYIGQRSLALYVLIWVSLSWIDFTSWLPEDISPSAHSMIVFLLATLTSLLLHDLLCLIPGVERLIFGRKIRLQSPFTDMYALYSKSVQS